MSRIQEVWDLIRSKTSFSAKDVMSSDQDVNVQMYLRALERGGYIVQTKKGWKTIEREYLLILDTGKKCPTYRTKGRGFEEMIVDNNISREVFLKGKKTAYDPMSVNLASLIKFAQDKKKFSYREGRELFLNEEAKKGYNYGTYHYYLDTLLEKNIIVEHTHHNYIYNHKK